MEMTLIRQVWLTLFGVLLFALLGSLALHAITTRESLRSQLQMHNDDGAAALAFALSQQGPDEALLRASAATQFDAGNDRRLRLLRSDGSVLFDRERPALARETPAWFARLLPVDVPPGVAPLSHRGQPIGSVQLSGHAAWAADALWHGCVRMVGWLGALGLLALGSAAWAVGMWRRPLEATVAHARALEDRRFVLADEPQVPELRRLTRCMNTLVQRLQGVLESQAAQLDELRAQAHLDAVTGLLNRRQFLTQLQTALSAERHRGAGLLLARVRQLETMNRRIGHDATDRLLAALAQVLQSYPRNVKGALAGRLNGADFALYLPATGMAAETAATLVDALRAALATVDQGAELVIGGAELPVPCSAASALAVADRSLAQAETGGAFAVDVAPGMPSGAPSLGQKQWHERLTDALAHGRIALAEFPVQGADGQLLHLDCPTRLQLEPDGPFEPALHWLAMAVRCAVVAQVDLAALELALDAVRRDGRPRSINVAESSLATEGFIGEVQQRLEAAPAEATRLSFDFVAGAARYASRLRAACEPWRRSGARIGLDHAGADLRNLSRLPDLGLDYVRIDAAMVHGVATLPAVRELARGLVGLLHGMGVQILAEAVEDESDLAQLWLLGFDGATGPALRDT